MNLPTVDKIILSLVIVLIALTLRIFSKKIIKNRLNELTGHENLVHMISLIMIIAVCGVILYVWDVVSLLVSLATTIGIIGVILGFTIKDIWLSDAFAGIALTLDHSLNIGDQVEIMEKKGTISRIALTTTRVMTEDGYILIVPNRKLKEEIIAVK